MTEAPEGADGTSTPRTPRCMVLLASFNGAQYIRQQLQSIFDQEGVLVETVVADDASGDATAAIVESLGDQHKVRMLRRKTGSGSAAQNFAQLFREVDVAGVDYVALSDQDDIWLPDKLRRATERLAASEADGYSCSVIARWPDGREVVFRQSVRLRDADYLFEGGGQGCTFVLTRALFENIQRVFRARADLTAGLIYHDWAIYALARAQGIGWVFDSEPFIIYRQHAANDTGARHSIDGLRRRLHLLMDGRYARQVRAIGQLCTTVAPRDRLARKWIELDSGTSLLAKRIGKALFCVRYGRRRLGDRIITTVAALAGWL